MDGIDRNVVSPSLFNPAWGDLANFVYNPDFDLGVDADFLPEAVLTSTSKDESIVVEQLQENTELPSAAESTNAGENPSKRLKLSLSREKSRTKLGSASAPGPMQDLTNAHAGSSRFAKPVTSPEREKAAQGVIPSNTEASTQWAVRTYNAWAINRSFVNASEAVPDDLLASHDPQLVCQWLCRFVMEARKSDGSCYPPSSLRSLVCGLNRVLQRNKAPFSVVDKSDHRFRDLIKTLDSLSSDLHRQGVGAVKHSAKVIDPKHEDVFWREGLLGYSSPKVLQRTVFFYVGLNFVLRGIQEQYDLVPLQFTRVPQDRSVYDSSVYYEYVEFVSKNNQHRFKDINMKNKNVRAYALPGNERCIVRLLDTYLVMLPPDCAYFYMRPLEKFPSGSKKCAVTKQRVGINVLKSILSELSEKSGVGVHYTNHSLRATAITRMFNCGVPEKVIAENSGHRSTKALRCYERTSEDLQQAVTKVINNPTNPVSPECMALTFQQSTQSTTSVMQLKEIASEDKAITKSSGLAANPSVGAFSGSFTNCTINISLK